MEDSFEILLQYENHISSDTFHLRRREVLLNFPFDCTTMLSTYLSSPSLPPPQVSLV